MNSHRQPVRFGPFEFGILTREVRRSGRRLKIQNQPFQVLTMLLEAPGNVVTREQLRRSLWPADTFVQFEGGLNRAVSKLRQALGDSPIKPKYVETVARYGYRFLGRCEIDSVKAVVDALRTIPSQECDMAEPDVSKVVLKLLDDLVTGSEREGSWILNPEDPGLLQSLNLLSAAQASQAPNGGASIAAHVEHLRYGF